MEKTELNLVDLGVCVYRTPALTVVPIGPYPVTLDLSGWIAPQADPSANPPAAGDEQDGWWNAPTYTTDLIPPHAGITSVVLAGSGEPEEIGPMARFSLSIGDPLALVDGGASVALTSLPGAYPRGAVEVTETD